MILETAAELFAERGLEAVSVREIARHAGVSHTLVNRYCGSKEELIRSVLLMRDTAFSSSLDESASVTGALEETTRSLLRARQLLRTTIFAALAHRSVADIGGFPAMKTFVERLEREFGPCPASARGTADDPRMMAAFLAASLLGWSVLDHLLLEAVGLGSLGEAEVLDALTGFEARIIGLART